MLFIWLLYTPMHINYLKCLTDWLHLSSLFWLRNNQSKKTFTWQSFFVVWRQSPMTDQNVHLAQSMWLPVVHANWLCWRQSYWLPLVTTVSRTAVSKSSTEAASWECVSLFDWFCFGFLKKNNIKIFKIIRNLFVSKFYTWCTPSQPNW